MSNYIHIGGITLDFGKRELPTREALRDFSIQIPEIEVSSVELLLQVLRTSYEIHYYIFDVLEKRYNLSEGKLMVMIILYQSPNGIAPSKLAEKACVTRATISDMLRRLTRDNLAHIFSDCTDGRGKLVALTENGRKFLDEILPEHFLRIAKLMKSLTEQEREKLVQLLKKINYNN